MSFLSPIKSAVHLPPRIAHDAEDRVVPGVAPFRIGLRNDHSDEVRTDVRMLGLVFSPSHSEKNGLWSASSGYNFLTILRHPRDNRDAN